MTLVPPTKNSCNILNYLYKKCFRFYNSKLYTFLLSIISINNSSRVLYRNHYNVLQNKAPIFFPAHKKDKENDASLRVTIYTDWFSNRVHRLAHCAKASGMRLQLLWTNEAQKGLPLTLKEEGLFDEIIEVQPTCIDMDNINTLLLNFGADIIHCHSMCTYNHTIFPIVLASKIPVVVDYYDLDHAQYDTWGADREENFKRDLFYEKFAFLHAGGRCFRSPYFELEKVKNITPKNFPSIFIPDVVVTSWCMEKIFDTKNINILLDGLTNTKDSDTFMYILSRLCSDAQYKVHVYRANYFRENEALIDFCIRNNVQLYDTIPYDEFPKFLNSIDVRFGIFSENFMSGYNQEASSLFSMNSIKCDIESGIITLYPERFKLMCDVLERAHRGISYTNEDVFSDTFWKDLPNKIRLLQKTNREIQHISEITYAPVLKKFYEDVIEFDCKRRDTHFT